MVVPNCSQAKYRIAVVSHRAANAIKLNEKGAFKKILKTEMSMPGKQSQI